MLFAIAVLGIGFIMIAAIFPVALLQTQTSLEETIGTAVTRNGVAYLRTRQFTAAKLPYTNVNLPVANPAPPAPPNPGAAFMFWDPRIDINQPPNNSTAQDDLWKSVKQNLIVADDPRFAFVPLYIRDGNSNFAKVIVIGVRVRNTPEFDPEKDLVRNGSAVANLEPRPITATLKDNTAAGLADDVTIANAGGGWATLSNGSQASDAAVEGAYLIISDDNEPDDTATPFTNEHGRFNGRVYRLGPQKAPGVFELAAGEDMESDAEDMAGATAFLVGRGYADPENPGNGYGGPSMAVQRYESIIALP